MTIYNAYFTPEFLKQSKRYPHLKKLLLNKINLLSQNPYNFCKSELLLGELKGLRSARVTKSFRLIFAICEECHSRNFKHLLNCTPILCNQLDSKTILFFTVGPHEKVY